MILGMKGYLFIECTCDSVI